MAGALRRASGRGAHARLVEGVWYVLTPSSAVVEASDTLSGRHDWVQESRELSDAMARMHVEVRPER